jgi:hypothetical protein
MNITHLFQHQSGLFDNCHRLDIVDAFGTWVKQYFKGDWNAYLFTCMFNHLPGARDLSAIIFSSFLDCR